MTTTIDAGHMGTPSLQDTDGKKVGTANENWGVKPEVTAQNATPAVAVVAPPAAVVPVANATPMTPEDYFSMLARLEQFKAGAQTALEAKLAEIDKKYAEERASIQDQLAKLGVNVASAAGEGSRRGRKRRTEGEPSGEAGVVVVRRTRPKNEKKLKDAIVDVIFKKNRINLKTIAEAVIADGFKTNSMNFSNTVRVQLYRLIDVDHVVIQYDDNTFDLTATKRAEMSKPKPVAQPV